MYRTSLFAVIAALFALFAGVEARADEARDAYNKAVQAFDAGRFSEAAEAFRKAHALKRSWKILYNVGQSEAAAKRYGLALDAFEAYLGEGGDDVDSARRDEVLGEIQRLKLLVGGIEVEGPEGATVLVDGVERGSLPLSARLRETAGVDHVVIIRSADGAELLTRSGVRVGSGEVVVVRLQEKKAEAPAAAAAAAAVPSTPEADAKAPATEPAKPKHGKLWTLGWVGVGVGAAVAIAGAVTGGAALSKQSELESACPNRLCASQSDLDLRDRVDALGLATDVLIPTGAVLAVAGAVLLIVDARRGGEESAVSAAPQVSENGGGLLVQGRF